MSAPSRPPAGSVCRGAPHVTQRVKVRRMPALTRQVGGGQVRRRSGHPPSHSCPPRAQMHGTLLLCRATPSSSVCVFFDECERSSVTEYPDGAHSGKHVTATPSTACLPACPVPCWLWWSLWQRRVSACPVPCHSGSGRCCCSPRSGGTPDHTAWTVHSSPVCVSSCFLSASASATSSTSVFLPTESTSIHALCSMGGEA